MLEDILANKRKEIEAAKAHLPLDALKARVSGRTAERNFQEAIRQPGKLSLIAELKRKSPSRGLLRERFDPVSLAQLLQEGGASALSVLTDEVYFGGHVDFLRDVKQFTEVPVLRKDFLIDVYQLYESIFYQADAVLLIVRILPGTVLHELLAVARSLGLGALVEVHSGDELDCALQAGAEIIGINVRDLATFRLQAGLVESLVPLIPSGKTIVAESGLQTAQEFSRMRELGVHAALVGEALMTAPDVRTKLRELLKHG